MKLFLVVIDKAAYAIVAVRLGFFDKIYGPEPPTDADILRGRRRERLQRRLPCDRYRSQVAKGIDVVLAGATDPVDAVMMNAARASVLCIGLACLSNSAIAAELAGTARVIDGNPISIADARIRLWGIDAPEREQTCRGKNGDTYECGRDAAAVLGELTRRPARGVRCTGS